MEAIIKSVKTWETIAHAPPKEWKDLPIMSNDNSTGDLVFPYDKTLLGLEGNWLVLGQRVWIIKAIKPAESAGKVTYTLQDALNAFYRTHIWPYGYNTEGELLAALFTLNYKNQGDAEYAMPYLNVYNTDASPVIQPVLTNDILFDMQSYIRAVMQGGIKIDIRPATVGQGLDVNISTRPTAQETIEFESGHAQLVSCETSKETVAKLTVVTGSGNTFYYLQADGSIGTTAPSPRLKGLWKTIYLAPDADPEPEVQRVFAQNSASHKVEFYSTRLLDCNAPVRIVLKNIVLDAAISYVAFSAGDDRYHYKAGDMPVTLSDVLKQVKSDASSARSSGGSGASAAGAVLYSAPQDLTDAEKAQARENIGASGSDAGPGLVRYDSVQQLTTTQKTTARNNIGAGTSNFDGRYSSLSNPPTIPTRTSQLENDSNFLTEHQDISGKLNTTGDGSKVTSTFTQASTRANIISGETLGTLFGKIKKFFADLKTVAFTGAYSDLSGAPTIPTVNSGKLTIKQGNTVKGEFSANSSDDVVIPLDGGVTMVNGKTGVVSLNADDINSTKPVPVVEFMIDGEFDMSLVGLTKDGRACTAADFIAAINSGSTVTVGAHDQTRTVTFTADPVKYTKTASSATLYVLASTGVNYSPAMFTLGGQYMTALQELDYRVQSNQALYANANDLPFAEVRTVEQYLEALDARLAALEGN